MPTIALKLKDKDMTKDILREIAPLQNGDFLYIADRHKTCFDYPIHTHDVFELNFVAGAKGVNRIVGDSSEVIGDFDLVLITSPHLEHVWSQNTCQSNDIHEITVQFNINFDGPNNMLNTNPFASIKKMCERAQKGLAFPLADIMRVYPDLEQLPNIKEGFYAVRQFFDILYVLSKSQDARELATTSFAKVELENESRRIMKIENYIVNHFMDEIRLNDLAQMVNMSPSAFSRFFKLSTSRSVGEYVVDTRLGAAARRLVDTTESVSTICYDCGFNTLSNFNRLFHKRKGCSPTEFREKYFKTKVII